MTNKQVLSSCTSMVFAGSETTAITLSSIFYHLLKHPNVHQNLMEELNSATEDGTIQKRSTGFVSRSDSQKLPYLDAVIQESFRVHPAPGLIIERVAPPQGITVCHEFIGEGTIVGYNLWVVHRRAEIFGADVDFFRPERWLEAKPEQLREMKAAMLMFGAGTRTFIGKNIRLLEIYKLVPTFLNNFDIELADPSKDWKTHNACVVNVKEYAQNRREFDLFAPLGCGIQTGSGAAINVGKVGPADVLCVLGLGGVGLSAIIDARVQGCHNIIGIGRVQGRLDLAKALGATSTINGEKLGGTTLVEAVWELAGGIGPTVSIDSTGAPILIKDALEIIRPMGKIIQVGAAPFDFSVEIGVFQWMVQRKQFIGAVEGHAEPSIYVPQMIRWYRQGKFPIDRLIKRFPASEFSRAVRRRTTLLP